MILIGISVILKLLMFKEILMAMEFDDVLAIADGNDEGTGYKRAYLFKEEMVTFFGNILSRVQILHSEKQ